MNVFYIASMRCRPLFGSRKRDKKSGMYFVVGMQFKCTRVKDSKSSNTMNSLFWRLIEMVNGKGPFEMPKTKLENTLLVKPTST